MARSGLASYKPTLGANAAFSSPFQPNRHALAPTRPAVTEVDVRAHASRATTDRRKDRQLARLGNRVLRVPAELVMVMAQLPVAVDRVRSALR